MLYLLDANVLITSQNLYYPINQVPEFWEWLCFMGKQGHIKIPYEIFDEVKGNNKNKDAEQDDLYFWIRDKDNRNAFLLDEEVNPELVQQVEEKGYAEGGDSLTDDELEKIGQDGILIAYALDSSDRVVVTTEISKPSKLRQNRKVPDVCKTMGVNCCDTFALNRALGFSTSWQK